MEKTNDSAMPSQNTPRYKDDLERNLASIEASISHAKKLINENTQMLEILRSYGLGQIQELDPALFIGPIAVALQDVDPSKIAKILSRWSTYFSPNIDDIVVFRDEVSTGLLTDPILMFRVVSLTEKLLRTAVATLRES